MDETIEIIPIAIPLEDYERQIANLIENLLIIDDKLFNENDSEAA